MPEQVAFECPAGIRRATDGSGTVLWVQSPRTGQRLELFLSAYFVAMLPPRFVSRVTHANSEGRGIIKFTLDELRGFKAVIDSIETARQHHTNIPANGNRRSGF